MPHSLETKAKMSESAKRRWAIEGEKEAQSKRLKEIAPWKGKTLSESHRQAISEGGRGVSHYISEGSRQGFVERGRKALEKVRSQSDYSAKLSSAVKRRRERGEVFGLEDPAVREKSIKTRIANGTLASQGSGRGICGFREGISHYCRSTLEANFARVLIELGVTYEYEPEVVRLSTGAIYIPDFLIHTGIPQYGIPKGYVETKGWSYPDGTTSSHEKIKAFERDRGVQVFVLVQKSELWKEIESNFKPRIPLWETSSRKDAKVGLKPIPRD